MYVNDNVLDNGLAGLKAAASDIYLCSQEPATFVGATSTYALGRKNFGAGAVFPNAIAAGAPNGRQLATAAVTDGAITASGSAAHWAITSAGASRLEAANNLSASQVVTIGNTFQLPSFTIRLPSQ